MRTLIFGSGAIGCYIGGALMASGIDTTFLIRPSRADDFQRHGLTLSSYLGAEARLKSPQFTVDLKKLDWKPDLVLLTVKCPDVELAAQSLVPVLKPSTLIVCLQNGVGSFRRAASHIPRNQIKQGMVPFNVVNLGEGCFHRSTEGALHFEQSDKLEALLQAWNEFGIPTQSSSNFETIQWGKLLLNLNNAINALAGIPLLEQLSQRPYRLVLSHCMSELLQALTKAGITPVQLTKAPPHLVPMILRLPNFLFRLVAQSMLRIDPLARSSMSDDLEAQKRTEIDFLNQAVVELAEKHGLEAQVNKAIVSLIKSTEERAIGSPKMSASELLSKVL